MSSTTETRQTTNTQVITRSLSKEDDTIPWRFVGSYEYRNCLDSFHRLLEISDEDQIEVYDSFLNSRPEFTYYQGVNTAFESPPDLQNADPAERSRFNDRFQKGGMAWMMALARIELGATMAMYSEAEFPYEDVAQSTYGSKEYLELLIDDATAHMKSLADEQQFRTILDPSRQIDTWTIAYLRRLKLMKDMLVTISRVAEPGIVSELKPLYDELEDHEASLTTIVNAWLTDVVVQTQNTTTREIKTSKRVTNTLIEDCQQQLFEGQRPRRKPSRSPWGKK